MPNIFDVDIDVCKSLDRSVIGVKGSMIDEDEGSISPHPSACIIGSEVPTDAITGMCSIDYREVESHGYHKIDLINNTHLSLFKSKKDFLDCSNRTPDWNLLLDEEFIKKLPHIHNHLDLMKIIEPTSIEELADCLAMIRPKKKKYVYEYKRNPSQVRPFLYENRKKDDGSFKKSHAISYSLFIIAVINKLKEENNLIIFK